jgi:hypothetical protein
MVSTAFESIPCCPLSVGSVRKSGGERPASRLYPPGCRRYLVAAIGTTLDGSTSPNAARTVSAT